MRRMTSGGDEGGDGSGADAGGKKEKEGGGGEVGATSRLQGWLSDSTARSSRRHTVCSGSVYVCKDLNHLGGSD